MKKLFIILSLVGLISSCKKDDDDNKPSSTNCPVNVSLVNDVKWHHLTGTLAELTFASSGIYYENTTNDGNWTCTNGCDSIYVTRPSNSFYYRVLSVSADTLKLRNPAFGDITYFK